MTFDPHSLILMLAILIMAILYSSVGHAGASGYLAVMALMGVAPEIMKPTALTLNILVALIASWKFCRIGAFSWRLFWPLAITSVPMAWLGGYLVLPAIFYQPLVGLVLLYAAWHSFFPAQNIAGTVQSARLPVLMLAGALLGLLSGLTGVGGGIFLSPLLLLMRWAEIKVISGIAAVFILLNSSAGLLGLVASGEQHLPAALPLWALAAVIGGFIGAELGSRYLANKTIKKLLGVVLLIAGGKMLLASGLITPLA